MPDFVPALLELKNASPAEVVRKLHLMFQMVTRLSLSEAIAAYQTVRLVTENSRSQYDPSVQHLLSALESQMVSQSTFMDRHRIESVLGKRVRMRGDF